MMFVNSTIAQSSNKELVYTEFICIVKQHHPLMMKAEQLLQSSSGNLLSAKGAFDPVLKGNFDQKEFQEKRYYQLTNAGLIIPTLPGVDIKAGYSQSYGDYLNSMDYTPADGLIYAGVEIPLGKGLFFDKRRSDLNKAKLMVEISEQEKRLLENELILNAGLAYWLWFESYHQKEAAFRLMQQAEVRLSNTKNSAQLGDKPFIDTLEAHIQLQNIKSLFLDYENEFSNASSYLEVFLWADGRIPLQLDSVSKPQSTSAVYSELSEDYVQHLLNDSLVNFHPSLESSRMKIDLKEVELKYRMESLKPKVNLKYNFLHEPTNDDLIGFNPNDYKFGLDMEIPNFLRSARGQVRETRAEILMYEADYLTKKEELQAKQMVNFNNLQNAYAQEFILRENVNNYKVLLSSENKLFEIGESSMMMINYREMALLEAELKWLNKLSKTKTAELKLLYSAGLLD